MKRQKFLVFSVVFFAIVFITITGHTDSSEVATYLNGEPATLMDLGMYKLSLYLKEILQDQTIENISPDAYTKYDSKSNKIFIKAMYIDRENINKDYSSQALLLPLKKVILLIRKELGINQHGKPYFGKSNLEDLFFSHKFSDTNDEPDNFGRSLDEMTVISVSFFNSGKFLKCSGPLAGMDSTCGESRKP